MSAPPSPVWMIPPPHADFVNRELELVALQEALSAGGVSALTQPADVHGLGGVGKTQLALGLAAPALRPLYGRVLAARGEPDRASRRLRRPGRRVATARGGRARPAEAHGGSQAWLGSHQSGLWLLIFDNAKHTKT